MPLKVGGGADDGLASRSRDAYTTVQRGGQYCRKVQRFE